MHPPIDLLKLKQNLKSETQATKLGLGIGDRLDWIKVGMAI